MGRSRYTKEHIIAVRKQGEARAKVFTLRPPLAGTVCSYGTRIVGAAALVVGAVRDARLPGGLTSGVKGS